jgi:RNA polymerase sigma-70 factor (ECF subfamily)
MVEAGDEEQSWMARSREGDQQAFEALMLRYQKMIFALTYRMTGSAADAEDLTQETFIAAFHQLDSFRGESKFSSWLYRIATNRSLNWRQRDARREQAYESWGREREIASTTEPHVDAVSAQVQQALLKLDDRQRAAVVLTTYEGLNHAEAARVLGCSETTVSWRIFAARRKLKKWLTPLVQGGARE